MCSKFSLASALALVLVMAACGDDSSSDNNTTNDMTSNDTTSNNMTSNDTTGTDQVDNSGKVWAERYQMRFDSMTFDPGTAAASLNPVLAQNFDQSLEFPVVVLMDIAQIDLSAGTAKIRAGSGLKTTTEGVYIWDPEGEDSYDDGTLVGDSGRFQGTLEKLNFVATLVTETGTQKVVIPIQKLEFAANIKLSEDAMTASIGNGTMAGFVTKVDGENTQVTLIPGGTPLTIAQLFKDSNLNYDSTTGQIVEKGTGDSWWLTAKFTAVPTRIEGQ